MQSTTYDENKFLVGSSGKTNQCENQVGFTIFLVNRILFP